ncbi:unnamed protein product [Peniophora sp. CBMAI 1063]|nr:unnamed protein product [Peniophora sp. CBMAI 1063]
MSGTSGSTCHYHPTTARGEDASHYEPQLRAWAGHGHMPYRHEPPAYPNRVPQSAYMQGFYNAVVVDHHGYTPARGSAGYAHQTTNSAIAATAGFPSLPPHNTKTRESGQSSVADDALYPVEVGYRRSHHHHHVHHNDLHGHDPLPPETPPTYTHPYPVSNEWRRRSIIPPIPEAVRSQSNSLANALGDVILNLDSPTSTTPSTRAPPPLGASTQTPSSQNVWPAPPIPSVEALPVTPDQTEDVEQDIMRDMNFIYETGSPDSTTTSTSSRARTSGSPAEAEPQRRRVKRTRGPNKGPRKDPGFLACFFCRGRKISCNPVQGSEDKTCE